MKTRTRFGVIAFASFAALTAGPALAQDITHEEAEAAVAARQELLEQIGELMDTQLGPMARNQAPFDAALVQTATATLAELAQQIGPAFEVDTSAFDDIETEARDAVWQSYDSFLGKVAVLQTALADLQENAAAGERGPIMRAVGGVGRSCGSCHDAYRAE